LKTESRFWDQRTGQIHELPSDQQSQAEMNIGGECKQRQIDEEGDYNGGNIKDDY
jgi:hypothetical protein